MGGCVALTIREDSGKEHRMLTWTNMMPWFITSMKMVRKEPTHLAYLLDPWEKLHKLWRQKRGGLEVINGGFFSPYDNQGLHPESYGLIVIDMKNNVILDMNDYTHVGMISGINIHLDARNHDDDIDGYLGRFKTFYRLGRLKKAMDYYDGRGYRNVEFDPGTPLKKILDMLDRDAHRTHAPIGPYDATPSDLWSFVVDMDPFEVRTFEKTVQGCRDLEKAVLDLGFELSDKETRKWARFEKHLEEQDKIRSKHLEQEATAKEQRST